MPQEIKQIIIIRKDLGMNKGKMIAQSCHASLGVVLSKFYKEPGSCLTTYTMQIKNDDPLNFWLSKKFTKICLQVNSEEELLDLHKQAEEARIINCLIKDAGETYFHGVPTYTCLAIGPDYSEKIDKITGQLKLI